MLKSKSIVVLVSVIALLVGTVLGADLEETWGDFLHYTKIGRFDLATDLAHAILDSQPDPARLAELAVANDQGYQIMLRVHENRPDEALAAVTDEILTLIDKGHTIKRSDPRMIVQEVKRLNTTERGRLTAIQRLKESGEFAIPYLLDVLSDPTRGSEFPNVIWALSQIGQPAIRPLGVAIQSDNVRVRTEVIVALGNIAYPQGLPYLKYIVENDPSQEMRDYAAGAIAKIDPSAMGVSAAELFFRLAEKYYYHHPSLSPTAHEGLSNVWFWDTQRKRLVWEAVDSRYFNELMAMRCCEWALKADPAFGRAVGLWLAGFFKAEAVGIAMPKYFGSGHASAFVYGTSAGPMYLHQALARGLDENNADVARAALEALIVTAGEQSIFAAGPEQPVIAALGFGDPSVRTLAGIAVATAGPRGRLTEGLAVVKNLAAAVAAGAGASADANSREYALRSLQALAAIGRQRNAAFDLSDALEAVVAAGSATDLSLRMAASEVLAYIPSAQAQRTIAAIALDAGLADAQRIDAFGDLAVSGKLSGNLLANATLQEIYRVIQSTTASDALRSAASTAFGALNLPSENVKSLILDQAKS